MAIAEYQQALHKLLPLGTVWQWGSGSDGDRLLAILAAGYQSIDGQLQTLPQQAIDIHKQAAKSYSIAGLEEQFLDHSIVGVQDNWVALEAGFEAGAECRPAWMRRVITIYYRLGTDVQALREYAESIRLKHTIIELLEASDGTD